jgi:phage gp16-like protein
MTKRTVDTHYADRFKKAELAKIHIAKQQLGLDDETYRAILRAICNVDSSKDLDANGRAKLLAHFKQHGFKPKLPKNGVNHHPNRPKSTANNPQLKKIEALLATAKQPWAYAIAIAKHMFKKEKLEFCTGQELRAVIIALIKQQAKG